MQITAWIQKRLTGTSQDWSGFHYFSLFTKTYKAWQSFSHPSLFFPGSASLPTSISLLRQQRGWGIGVGVTPKCQKTCVVSMGCGLQPPPELEHCCGMGSPLTAEWKSAPPWLPMGWGRAAFFWPSPQAERNLLDSQLLLPLFLHLGIYRVVPLFSPSLFSHSCSTAFFTFSCNCY